VSRVRAWLHRLNIRIGLRGSVLLFFGELDLVYAYVLAFPSERTASTPIYQYFGSLAPLPAWGLLWATVGLICIYHAFHRYDRFGFVAAIAIKVLWGLLSLLGVWFADVSISSVAIWLSLAGLVWRLSGVTEPITELTHGSSPDES
jgi:hypothetical protein